MKGSEASLLRVTRQLNMCKVVVGDGRAGKTSLLRVLRGDKFNHLEKSTCGVQKCSVECSAETWKPRKADDGGEDGLGFESKLADEFLRQQKSVPESGFCGAMRGHSGGVYSAQFGPDGQKIVSAGCDRTVRVWSVKTAP